MIKAHTEVARITGLNLTASKFSIEIGVPMQNKPVSKQNSVNQF